MLETKSRILNLKDDHVSTHPTRDYPTNETSQS